jgi:hypothetical protein
MPGYADCDGQSFNGCEVDLQTDPGHCGDCAKPCSNQGGIATCTNGMCGITCIAGHDDCNNSVIDGCETNLTTIADCGKCNNACPGGPNATAACVNQKCTLACVGLTADCDTFAGNGCEVDTSTDPNNCGGCNHPCGALSCVNGQCQAIVLAGNLETPLGIFLDNGYLYFSEGGSGAGNFLDGRVSRMPLAGGPIEILATNVEGAGEIYVDATDVYVASAGDINVSYANGAIYRLPKAGGALTQVVGLPGAFGLTSDGTTLYASGIDPNAGIQKSVISIPKVGGAATTLASVGGSYHIAFDAGFVYYSDYTNGGTFRVPIGGGISTNLYNSFNSFGVAINATNVFVSDTSQLATLPLAGGVSTILATGGDIAYQLIDGQSLYFTDFAGANLGSVSKVPVGGGVVQELASGLTTPYSMVTDATWLYVAEYGSGAQDGSIRKLPK